MNNQRQRILDSREAKKTNLKERFANLIETISPDILSEAVDLLENEEERLEDENAYNTNFISLTAAYVASSTDYIVLNKYAVEGCIFDLNKTDGRTAQGKKDHFEASQVSRAWEVIKRTPKILTKNKV
jgi:hypothetical protein